MAPRVFRERVLRCFRLLVHRTTRGRTLRRGAWRRAQSRASASRPRRPRATREVRRGRRRAGGRVGEVGDGRREVRQRRREEAPQTLRHVHLTTLFLAPRRDGEDATQALVWLGDTCSTWSSLRVFSSREPISASNSACETLVAGFTSRSRDWRARTFARCLERS